MKAISMDDVRRKHHGHWFDPDAMRFFHSRVGEDAYMTDDGSKAYFISSEQYKPWDRPPEPRLFTVRVIDMQTGEINDASEFQEFGSRNGAKNAARRAADGGPINVPGHPGTYKQ